MTIEVDGQPALGFDTGLDSRAFAQAKLTQYITEPGFIVRQDTVQCWKASGVIEYTCETAGERSTMVVWGPPFAGERLDVLLNGPQDTALTAILNWMRAVITLDQYSPAALSGGVPFWPGAAIIQPAVVFFAPPGLAMRCLISRETTRLSGGKWFVHPDLDGMNAAVFTAAAMLYRVFSGAPPFPATDDITLHQDMRDSNFLPVRLAVPGLDERLSALMQTALQSGSGKSKPVIEAPSLRDFLAVLQPEENQPGTAPSEQSRLINPLSEDDRLLIEKEKSQFLLVKKTSVNTRRFVMRHATLLLCSFAAVAAVILVAVSMARSRAAMPNTAGMSPIQVIECYYNAFGELDHQMMEACVLRGVGKEAINMVTNLYVISRVRQAYEYTMQPIIMPAGEWQEMGGGPVESEVFGVTDLQIQGIGDRGSGNEEQLHFRVEYTLWVPAVFNDSEEDQGMLPEMDIAENRMPNPRRHSEELTLVQRNGNWRISQIKRN